MRLLGHRPQDLSIAVTKSNIYSKSPRFKSDPLHDARFSRSYRVKLWLKTDETGSFVLPVSK
ncbi:hypothetical protein M8994_06525 [Brucella sp. 21LCYQ03]|nr:hypothetical protein [Brucella sp. 21LCYQ03]